MAVQWPEHPTDRPCKTGNTVVIYLRTGEQRELARCMRFVDDNALTVVAITHDWPGAQSMYRSGAARAILVAPGDPHRRAGGVIVAGPDDVPPPGAALSPDEVHLIRRCIATGESTQQIIQRVTEYRRRHRR